MASRCFLAAWQSHSPNQKNQSHVIINYVFSRSRFYMPKLRILTVTAFLSLAFCLGLNRSLPVQAGLLLQQPTGSIPTVTSSPSGPIAIVTSEYDQINIRSGPDNFVYPIIGVLVAGQRVEALGRTPGGSWVQITYPGVPGGTAWVYAYLVELQGNVPIVDPPPTPTPQVTPTIDPTLASQFIIDIAPTRLPTYTPPPPVIIPTYTVSPASQSPVGVPMGFVIIGMAVVGLFGMLISLLRGR
jgi:uncharacterized protein YraI